MFCLYLALLVALGQGDPARLGVLTLGHVTEMPGESLRSRKTALTWRDHSGASRDIFNLDDLLLKEYSHEEKSVFLCNTYSARGQSGRFKAVLTC